SARIVYVAPGKSVVDLDVLSDGPAQLLQSLPESGVADLCLRIVRGVGHEGADTPNALALLRPRRERPRRRASNQRDELAAPHSITSSARSRKDSGIVRPSALAVVRLMMRSNLVGCSTGMSPGFAPDVACLTAAIPAVADVTITSTLRRTNSAAISATR